MSWLQRLYQTYEKVLADSPDCAHALMPINHTLQNAHIKIVIDQTGEFIRAEVLEKTQIVLPATEKSAGRSSGEAPHALADKLQYVAGDYAAYGGKKKHYYQGFLDQLSQWCQSASVHPKVKSVLAYVAKGSVIQDLIAHKVCYTDEEGVLRTHWPFPDSEEQPTPLLFKVLPKEKGQFEQGSALVCWEVIDDEPGHSETWLNAGVQQSWIAFEASRAGDVAFCYVTGESQPAAVNHPAKLRHSGDKAKLISSNDTAGFTFRGRAESSGEIANIGAEVTQKAHNALGWLIANQPRGRTGDQAIVCWAMSGNPVPEIMVGSHELTDSFTWVDDEHESPPQATPQEADSNTADAAQIDYTQDVGQRFAKRLGAYMQGYQMGKGEPYFNDTIVIMGVDSATPGRMGIAYYREKRAEEFIEQLQKWHTQFAWPQRLKKETTDAKGKTKEAVQWILSAPSPWNILQTAYGDIVKSNETLKKSLNERLLPCLSDGRPLPSDLMKLAINRASNPNSGEYWEWERNLGVACALYRGFHARHPDPKKQKDYSMSLERNNQGRDYLYGRLLAVAENIEQFALDNAKVNRPTAANRLMQRFAQKPMATWSTIYSHLNPYVRQLQSGHVGFINTRLNEMDEIKNLFSSDTFASDAPLSGEYLLGFHSQRIYMRQGHLSPKKAAASADKTDSADKTEHTDNTTAP